MISLTGKTTATAMAKIRNLAIYFCVFSFAGHWLEAAYCLFIKWGMLPGVYDPTSGIWRDWLFPFCVYGVGAVTCVLVLSPAKALLQRRINAPGAPLAISFVLNSCVCCLIELCMGLVLNQPLPDGSMPLWDYRGMFCNFMGQICLQNGLAFGMAATLMSWVLLPLMNRGLANVGNAPAAVICAFALAGLAGMLV